MKTLYLDCGMGAAGDMLTAALYELLDDSAKQDFIKYMNGLGIPNVVFEAEPMTKCGIVGTHMKVTVSGVEEDEHLHDHEHHHEHDHHEHDHEHHHEHDHHEHDHDHHHEHDHHEHDHDHYHEHHHHEHDHDHYHEQHHHHTGMEEIRHIIESLQVSDKVKSDVVEVYRLIADAESHVHGVEIEQIHFHEVGSMDAVADVAAVCLLIEKLGIETVVASPVHVGSGQVRCAHGILPVPAPATAHILREVPIYSGDIRGELCTPTGAALLKHFATDFSKMPVMTVEKIGYGMGKKDFAAANCVRAMLGETAGSKDDVLELSCNIDDMTAECLGFAMDRLFEAGALDVYTLAIGMKKSRPGTMLNVLCKPSDKDKIVETIFKHTTTIGIRENSFNRYVLNRSFRKLDTPLGEVGVKVSEGYGVKREKYEYDDLARIAKEQGMSVADVIKIVNE